MELIINELSTYPLSEDKYRANDKMILFSKAVAEARKKGFRHIRTHYSAHEIQLTEDYSLYNWLFDKEFPEIYRSIFYDMFVQPFIREDDVEIVDQYIESEFYFEDSENGFNKQKCLGFASAYLYDTLSISLQSHHIWLKNIFKITVEKEKKSLEVEVKNTFSTDCFNHPAIKGFIEESCILSLLETDINPDDKHVHLADHHGKQELKELCDRLKYNPYVVEMRSMEWCRGKCSNFIKKTHDTGVIEIVLYNTDCKYALWVQTTGRNFRETNAIAEILEENYS